MTRRAATAVGIYVSAVLGFAATIVAARTLSSPAFGLYAIILATTGFFQTLLDLTVEEAVLKYGFRYEAAGQWGKFRALLAGALRFKLVGGLVASLVIVALAPAGGAIWGDSDIAVPLAVAAAIPLAQAPEGLAGALLFLRGRYDVRSAFLAVSMGLRFAAVAVGVQYGLTETMVAIVLAQIVATAAVGAAGLAAFRRFPQARSEPLAEDRRRVFAFVLQSSVATGIISLRSTLTVSLVGAVTSATQAAYFRVAQAPQQGMATLSAPARMILVTEQTRDWERGSREAVLRGVKRYSGAATLLMLVVVPPLIWFMPDLVRFVYKPRNLGAVDAARLVLVAGAIQFIVGWSKSLPVAVGRPNLRIWTHGLEALVLLPLVVVFGLVWDATGAAAAVLVSSGVFALAWLYVFLGIRRNALPVGPHEPEPAELIEPPAQAFAP